MESIYTELALYGSKNECAMTDNVFSPISEVCDGKVSLGKSGDRQLNHNFRRFKNKKDVYDLKKQTFVT